MADRNGSWTDAELLARHVDGDAEAFAEVFRRHRDRMWAIALRTMGDPEDAADALQDALISAFRRADSYRGEAAVTTWLHRIVVNACLDRIRRRSVRPTVPLIDQRLPDTTVERELQLDVTAALQRLPAEQRSALVLVDMQGYPVEEAAAILGVPVGTVKSRCSRGRAKLLPYLAHLRPAYRSQPKPRNRSDGDTVQPATTQAGVTRSGLPGPVPTRTEGGERTR